MTSPHIRPAALDDAAAISALSQSRIGVWQRLDSTGRVEDVPYAALTVYDRWLHGGPWMSVETASIHLCQLLLGAGLLLVAEHDGRVIACAEAYVGREPEPFGDHLHLAHLLVDSAFATSGLETNLIHALGEQAAALKCARLTASAVVGDAAASDLYARHGMAPLSLVKRYALPARSGQGFYRVVDHANPAADQIARWFMPVGRVSSARQQWEALWPRTWDAIPEIRQQKVYRVGFSASGQEALVHGQPLLYAPRTADLALWSPKPLTAQMVTALRDWMHREGFRTLLLTVTDETARALGPDAEPDGYAVETYSLTL
ncbi:MAG: GNAT family N-acetyltransferase [Anaerolineae bacterium]|nr:GNAT family N-acetyltransferase [Anaerolineae bacterium]